MNEVSRGGRTVLFVSHNMAAVENLCQRGIVLHQGKLVFQGPLKESVQFYLNSIAPKGENEGHIIDLSTTTNRTSKVGKLLERIELYTNGDTPATQGVRLGDELKLRICFHLPKPAKSFDIGLGFDDLFGQRIFTAHSLFEAGRPTGEFVGPQVFVCEIPSFTLMAGMYNLRIWLDIHHQEADLIDDAAHIQVLGADYYGTGKAPWNGKFVLPHRWYVEAPEHGGDPAVAYAASEGGGHG
jgi:lipopolysaccharide transport system ATP-binding protein